MLAVEGEAAEPSVQSAVAWLLREQEPGGSWFGRWGANHLYGTGAAVPALVAARAPLPDRRVQPAARARAPPPDRAARRRGGGRDALRCRAAWGWAARGPSPPSQAAWGLLAMISARALGPATRRG